MTAWVLTGLSGAGKATALSALEQAGVECVDNLPVDLIEAFAALPRAHAAVAVVDARQQERLSTFAQFPGLQVVFLDAGDDVLVRRNAESTRPHPCAASGGGLAAVATEREMLAPLRAAADVVIDTTQLDARELQQRVRDLIADGRVAAGLAVTLSSFGYKFGLPLDADWVVDSRMIRNPFWDPSLRPMTGLDPEVRSYVLEDPVARELVHRMRDLLRWSAGAYVDHGRHYIHVAIGCTGGRHRSVVLAEGLAAELRSDDVRVAVRHRDVEKPDPR